MTKPQTSQTTNILTESLKNAQKKKKSIFDDSDGSESDSENDVNQDTTNDSTTKVDHTETSDGAKANVEIAEDKGALISECISNLVPSSKKCMKIETFHLISRSTYIYYYKEEIQGA